MSGVIDQTRIAELVAIAATREEGYQFVQELTNSLFEKMPLQIIGLQQAVMSRDHKAAELLAHQLKGLCANLGILNLSVLFEVIEEESRLGLGNRSQEAANSLQHEFALAKSALEYLQHSKVA